MRISTQWPTSRYWPRVLFYLIISISTNSALATKPEITPELKVDHNGITLDSNTGYVLNLGGQFHSDALLSKDKHFGRDIDIRRARLVAALNIHDAWKLKLGYDFSPDRSGWRNVWIQNRITKKTSIRIGQFITPFSMEEMQASKDIIFIERALPQALASRFRLGGQIKQRFRSGGITAAIMADPINNKSSSDDGLSLVFRGVVQPYRNKRYLTHMAIAIEHRLLDSEASTQIKSNHEISLIERHYLRSEKIQSADSYTTINLELAQAMDSFLFQSQFIARITRPDSQQTDHTKHLFSYGGYGQISWLSKSGKRRYSRSSGVFRGLSDKATNHGLLELSARLSYLALDLGDTVASETGVTLGVGWLFNQNVKLSTNFSFNDINTPENHLSAFAVQSRIQFNF